MEEEIAGNRSALRKTGKSQIVINHNSQEKEIDKMIYEIEKNQKLLNCIESNNYRRRQKINTLRKDRAVFDKVFKGIEMNILKEEKQMIKKIKSLRKKEEKLKKVKKDLEQLETVIGGNHREKLVEEIHKVYKTNCLEYSGHEDDQEFLGQLTQKEDLDILEGSSREHKFSELMSVDVKNSTHKNTSK